MAITITDSKLEGILKWVLREPWLGHFHKAINDHFHAYFDKHDTDTFDRLVGRAHDLAEPRRGRVRQQGAVRGRHRRGAPDILWMKHGPRTRSVAPGCSTGRCYAD